ncbi:pyrimidine/purine nucleoside phosphorylase [Candidatus Manganitrophus noduliformans]|uniref:Pyrimidine/purine nucleoside phosphorylase n=1 Tax=Candidatus Manganitrophus noduliformans TaxID=2606439 RepID=A0A7X6DM53_9BACT|nr:pyrimidine/purine nucleoside phosphorylase [Candidatus Manganitrophus noduliformans]NKE69735.1 pyrimidine/purine nucleoside phosphorylase [Candidatus Manganitrophus noduliformans]
MSEFKNVTVKKAANVFFDGKVTSRTVLFPDGSRKTLGIMQPGEFEFKIGDQEIMEILSGDLEVFLEGENGWKRIKGGAQFTVPARTTFKLKVHSLTDYCCSFVKA